MEFDFMDKENWMIYNEDDLEINLEMNHLLCILIRSFFLNKFCCFVINSI